jgi:hypothetical protein
MPAASAKNDDEVIPTRPLGLGDLVACRDTPLGSVPKALDRLGG